MSSPHTRSPRSPPRDPKDPLKSSILANSSQGWSPLRIGSKRDDSPSSDGDSPPSPQYHKPIPALKGVVRRSSSSYTRVAHGSLVSNSPFKSDGPGPLGARYRPPPSAVAGGYPLSQGPRPTKFPTPLTRRASPSAVARRVSGESAKKRRVSNDNVKRIAAMESAAAGSPLAPKRIPSLTAQVTQPLGFKRRQSKGLQGLAKAEYVSKSPFLGSDGRIVSGSSSTGSIDTREDSDSPSPQHPSQFQYEVVHVKDEEFDDDQYEDIDLPETPRYTQPPITPTKRRLVSQSPHGTPDNDNNSPSAETIALHARVAALAASSPLLKSRSPSRSPSGTPRPSPKPSPRQRQFSGYQPPIETSPTPSATASSPTTLVEVASYRPPPPPHSPSPSPAHTHSRSQGHRSDATPTKSALKTKRRLRGPRSRSPSRSPNDRPAFQTHHRRNSGSGLIRVGSANRGVYRAGSGGRVVRLRNGSLRRERRKTVTFDERCDVVEFERDDAQWEDDEDEYEYDEDEEEIIVGEDGEPLDVADGEGEWITSDGSDAEEPLGRGYPSTAYYQQRDSYSEVPTGNPPPNLHHEEEVINGLVQEILEDEMRRMSFGGDGDSLRDEGHSFSMEAESDRSTEHHQTPQHARTHSTIQEEDEQSDHARWSREVNHDEEDREVAQEPGPAARGSAGGLGATLYSLPEFGDSSPFMADGLGLPSTSSQASSLSQATSISQTSTVPARSPPIDTRIPVYVGSGSRNSPIPHSPIGISPSSSFPSAGSGASLVRTESGRSPRISKEEVQRRLMRQREGRFNDQTPGSSREGSPSVESAPKRPISKSLPIPPQHQASAMARQGPYANSHEPVLQSTSRDPRIDPSRPSLGDRSLTTDGNIPGPVQHELAPSIAASFGVNTHNSGRKSVDINDVKSALDRLMIGVERGFNDERTEPPPGAPHSRPTSAAGPPSGWNASEYRHAMQQQMAMVQAPSMSPRESITTTTEEDDEDTPRTPPSTQLPYTRSHQSDGAMVVNPEHEHGYHHGMGDSDEPYSATRMHPEAGLPPPPVSVPLARAKSGREVIKAHEAAILAKRREMRARNGSQSSWEDHVGRPKKRRSLSTGDADDDGGVGHRRSRNMDADGGQRRSRIMEQDVNLNDVPVEEADLPFTDSVERELRKMFDGDKAVKYQLRERDGIIYASAGEKVKHIHKAGDVDRGRAWRAVRRASDMNEYARQIREFRAQEKPGKACGKVFVKVLGVKGLDVPIPSQPTAYNCTLNNGIHCVATPDCRMAHDSKIDQEFELIEHGQLEFTLTLKVRKDPHVIAQMQAMVAPPLPPPPPRPSAPTPTPPMPKSGGGLFGFFAGAPKKSKHKRALTQPEPQMNAPPPPPRHIQENLARYLRPDGTLARAFISFKDIAKRCDTRLFETSYSLIGQVTEEGGEISTRSVGDIVLQVFRLPPLPGVKPEDLPQSLDECHRGLRHIAWHKVMYHEGVLTQNGGDCSTWRRRHVRVIGASLVSYNDVTKKPTSTIELKKAVAVVDDQDSKVQPPSIARRRESYNDASLVKHSFRLLLPDNEEIAFFADNEEDKTKWLEILRALIGRIPPNPLWAELVWQRQEDLAAQAAAANRSNSVTPPPPPPPVKPTRRETEPVRRDTATFVRP